jgi:hypothetical protein
MRADNLSFEERELEILRAAVDKAESRVNTKLAQSDLIRDVNVIVEQFIRDKKLICYGGTAINNILPIEDQFYNKNVDIPDYDFFSVNAVNDAKELADIYLSKGYSDVEAKSGVHKGTYKVFVNFIPVADITYIVPEIYRTIKKDIIKVNGISYAPPNFLRMGMYLELSRPDGDVSRWEKVLKRLVLLNKNYPIKNSRCDSVNFQRVFEGKQGDRDDIYYIIRDSIIDQGLVFFGGFASTMYGKYMPQKQRKQLLTIPDFDVLTKDPEKTSTIIKERLIEKGYNKVKVVKKPNVGELIDTHYEIVVDKETLCILYKPNACHSYNVINLRNKKIKIATIDTMLSFYLAFIYSNRPYFDIDRLLCMSEYLFIVQSKNRLKQKGLLKRFTINCYGRQDTMEDIRSIKANKFKELQNKRGSAEYEEYFMRYTPGDIKGKQTTKKRIEKRKKTIKNTKSGARKKSHKKSRFTKLKNQLGM